MRTGTHHINVNYQTNATHFLTLKPWKQSFQQNYNWQQPISPNTWYHQKEWWWSNDVR